jgi:DNA-directed RNA polymerase specialized sigma24 family protein
MEQNPSSVPPFWMPARDAKGRLIDTSLREAAESLWPLALRQGEVELGETSGVAQIYESALFSVSAVMHRNGGRSGIRDLDAYLYWAFTRKLTKYVLHVKALVFLDSHELWTLLEAPGHQDTHDRLERDLLITQLVSLMDPRTKRIFLARVCGQTWADIGVDLGSSANGAQVMYNRGIRLLRERVQKRSRQKRNVNDPRKAN